MFAAGTGGEAADVDDPSMLGAEMRRRRLRRKRRETQSRVAAVTRALKKRVVARLQRARPPPWDRVRNAIITAAWYLTVLSVVSFAVYTTLYFILVPTAKHTFPVHLDFATLDGGGATAVFPLVPNGYTRLLSRGQGYNIDLSLVMPESEANARTGMFMATLALGSSRDAATHAATSSRPGAWCVGDSCGGSVTHSAGGAATAVSRPAVLRHRSWLLYAARTTVLAIPLLVGFVDEAQTLDVELFRNTKDNETHPYTWAAVVLSGRELEVWSAELRFHVHFTGATYLMHDWFYSSVVVGVWFTALTLFTLNVIGAWLYFRRGGGGWEFGWDWGQGWGWNWGWGDDDDDDAGDGDGDHFPFGDPLDRLLTDDDDDNDGAESDAHDVLPRGGGGGGGGGGVGPSAVYPSTVSSRELVEDDSPRPDASDAQLRGTGADGLRRRPVPD